MTCFRQFFNPATGELIKFTDAAETTSGELARFAWRSVPGGVITEHVHPHQEERFTITSGEARLTINGRERHARAGETVVVPADFPTTPRGAPRNVFQLGVTFWHFRHESRVTSPPAWIQNLMLPPLWALARALGKRPYYDHWDSRTDTEQPD